MDNSFSQALNLAYFFLKFRLRTEKEIETYLLRKKQFHFNQETIDKVISQLKDEGYVNDEKFVKAYVATQNKLRPKSAFALSLKLQKLGVNRDLVDLYFQKKPQDEVQLAEQALQKKIKTLLGYNPKTRFKKAISFLLRKGFSYELAKKTYQHLFRSFDVEKRI